jgi:hypothetical protein
LLGRAHAPRHLAPTSGDIFRPGRRSQPAGEAVFITIAYLSGYATATKPQRQQVHLFPKDMLVTIATVAG